MSVTESVQSEWYAGYLQGDFQQADILKTATQEFKDGVCMATCAYWIAHHIQYRSFWGNKLSTSSRLSFLKDKHKFAAICRAQSNYGNLARGKSESSNTEDYRKALATFLGGYGLGLTGDKESVYLGSLRKYLNEGRSSYVESASYKFEDLATFVNRRHTFTILNFDGMHPHTCAAYMSGGKKGKDTHLYFFDPNRGEFKVPAGEIDSFFAHVHYTFFQMEGGHSNIVGLRVSSSGTAKKV